MAVKFSDPDSGLHPESGAISMNAWLQRRVASQAAAESQAITEKQTATAETKTAVAVEQHETAPQAELAVVQFSSEIAVKSGEEAAECNNSTAVEPTSSPSIQRISSPAAEQLRARLQLRAGQIAADRKNSKVREQETAAVRKMLQAQLEQPELQVITAENFSEIAAAHEEYDAAVEFATKKLARKQLSEKELSALLLSADFGSELTEQIISEFVANGSLNDEELAQSLVEKYTATNSHSVQEIRRKLLQRKLDNRVISIATAQLDSEYEVELLQEAANKRAAQLQNLEYEVALRRLLGYLARRGWSGSQTTTIAKAALKGQQNSRGGGVRFR